MKNSFKSQKENPCVKQVRFWLTDKSQFHIPLSCWSCVKQVKFWLISKWGGDTWEDTRQFTVFFMTYNRSDAWFDAFS